jgi:hypothetical protein
MKSYPRAVAIASALALTFVAIRHATMAQNADSQAAPAASRPEDTTPYVTEIPEGYRDWKLISVAREEGSIDDIRAVLGNEIAIKAYREGTQPFPDGAIIARLAWSLVSSEENNKAFGKEQSHVAGAPKNGVQFMIKDAKKYAATGGWGYGQFENGSGKTVERAKLATCFACHEAIQARDYVFTHYAP